MGGETIGGEGKEQDRSAAGTLGSNTLHKRRSGLENETGGEYDASKESRRSKRSSNAGRWGRDKRKIHANTGRIRDYFKGCLREPRREGGESGKKFLKFHSTTTQQKKTPTETYFLPKKIIVRAFKPRGQITREKGRLTNGLGAKSKRREKDGVRPVAISHSSLLVEGRNGTSIPTSRKLKGV